MITVTMKNMDCMINNCNDLNEMIRVNREVCFYEINCFPCYTNAGELLKPWKGTKNEFIFLFLVHQFLPDERID